MIRHQIKNRMIFNSLLVCLVGSKMFIRWIVYFISILFYFFMSHNKSLIIKNYHASAVNYNLFFIPYLHS